MTIIKARINIERNKKYLLFDEKILKLSLFLFKRPPTPSGVPHELQTNLPDNARSALILELPQTKHLVAIITVELSQNII